jgi:hypothetical protein
MLTQAFAFESIRFLEGYWSSWFPVEWFANACCLYYRGRLKIVQWRRSKLIEEAWGRTEPILRREHAQEPSLEPHLSPEMINALAVQVLQKGDAVKLTAAEQSVVDSYQWRDSAPGSLLRRLKNIDKRLADYPSEGNMQPTRLGNVLRHYEEETGSESVELLVDEVFDRLPFSLQLSHDAQRGRLDLYCSMTFVWLFVTALAVVRLGWTENRSYVVVAIVVGLIAAYLTYRAAVASARYYGGLLLLIAQYIPKPEPKPAHRRWWQRLSPSAEGP